MGRVGITTFSGLHNLVHDSKERTELLISLGGATAVANVRSEWPDNDDVQGPVHLLADVIVSEMKAW
jgi:hypothetical protein